MCKTRLIFRRASHTAKCRIIVDEGHVMGKNTNNLIQFASWLTAQRRWAMTGTPTQQIATQNGLKNLYFLANFLNHQFFDRRLGREKVWNSLIGQGWKYGHLSSFFRLHHTWSKFPVWTLRTVVDNAEEGRGVDGNSIEGEKKESVYTGECRDSSDNRDMLRPRLFITGDVSDLFVALALLEVAAAGRRLPPDLWRR